LENLRTLGVPLGLEILGQGKSGKSRSPGSLLRPGNRWKSQGKRGKPTLEVPLGLGILGSIRGNTRENLEKVGTLGVPLCLGILGKTRENPETL